MDEAVQRDESAVRPAEVRQDWGQSHQPLRRRGAEGLPGRPVMTRVRPRKCSAIPAGMAAGRNGRRCQLSTQLDEGFEQAEPEGQKGCRCTGMVQPTDKLADDGLCRATTMPILFG